MYTLTWFVLFPLMTALLSLSDLFWSYRAVFEFFALWSAFFYYTLIFSPLIILPVLVGAVLQTRFLKNCSQGDDKLVVRNGFKVAVWVSLVKTFLLVLICGVFFKPTWAELVRGALSAYLAGVLSGGALGWYWRHYPLKQSIEE